jgi:hypothetical protein
MSSKVSSVSRATLNIVALIGGLISLIFSSVALVFMTLSFSSQEFDITSALFFQLLGFFLWWCVSLFLCLWGARRQSTENYLRLIGFVPAGLLASRIDGGPAQGLVYFGLSFIFVVVLWNCLISVWIWRKIAGADENPNRR